MNKAGSQPELFYNTGKKNVDFPASDRTWVDYFEQQKGIHFMPPPKATVCDLVSYYKGQLNGSVVYDSDGYRVYIALTIAGLDNILPISEALMGNHSCLKELRVMVDLRGRFGNKFAAYRGRSTPGFREQTHSWCSTQTTTETRSCHRAPPQS